MVGLALSFHPILSFEKFRFHDVLMEETRSCGEIIGFSRMPSTYGVALGAVMTRPDGLETPHESEALVQPYIYYIYIYLALSNCQLCV